MYRFKKGICIIIAALMILSALASATLIFAEEGNNPLFINECTPVDGSSNIPTDTEIKINFSKNVVNLSVKDTNLKCFSMKDNEGNVADVNVVMADDQIDRENRNDIILVPVNGLEEEKEYTITISSNLTAKNGNTLGEEKTITFSTVGFVNEDKVDIVKIALIIIIAVIIVFVVIKLNKKK